MGIGVGLVIRDHKKMKAVIVYLPGFEMVAEMARMWAEMQGYEAEVMALEEFRKTDLYSKLFAEAG